MRKIDAFRPAQRYCLSSVREHDDTYDGPSTSEPHWQHHTTRLLRFFATIRCSGFISTKMGDTGYRQILMVVRVSSTVETPKFQVGPPRTRRQDQNALTPLTALRGLGRRQL
jgi:hypothetical protein